MNNPVNLVDPSGQFAFLPLLLVGLAGGVLGGLGYYGLRQLIEADPCTGVQWDWGEAAFWGGVGGLFGVPIGVGLGWLGSQIGFLSVASQPALWPAPWYGRQVIRGLEYTVHALERMMPVGLGGRGVPPSAVETAIRFGSTAPGRDPGTVVHIFKNLLVVTDEFSRIVITLYRIGR